MPLTAAVAAQTNAQGLSLRTPLGDVMKFEILINEKSRVWIFHDQALPYRLAWVEFDPQTGILELMPHDMSKGILYADVPAALHARMRSADMTYLYQTQDDKVTGFQKSPIQIRKKAA